MIFADFIFASQKQRNKDVAHEKFVYIFGSSNSKPENTQIVVLTQSARLVGVSISSGTSNVS